MPPESFETRLQPLIAFALVMLMAMIAVGVYGADALRSVRFASARLLVAVSLGMIGLALFNSMFTSQIFGVRPCSTRCWVRSRCW
jgi:hypothetical protein